MAAPSRAWQSALCVCARVCMCARCLLAQQPVNMFENLQDSLFHALWGKSDATKSVERRPLFLPSPHLDEGEDPLIDSCTKALFVAHARLKK